MSFFATFKPERYWTILTGQVGLMLVASFMEESLILYMLFALAMLFIFGSVIATIWTTRRIKIVALIAGIVAFLSGFTAAFPTIPDDIFFIGVLVCVFAYALFILIAIGSMSHSVFVTEKVSSDRIVGSICIYLLIGMFFAFIFTGIDLIDPASFNFGTSGQPELQTFREYLYFSYTTLTTLGYGDMTPQLPFSRLLTSFESMIGPIYLAIMVARLVGMHVSQSVKRAR
jgi:voltage-gated potassium channel